MKLFTTGFCHQNTGAYLKQMWGGRGTSVEIGWWWYCKQLGLDPFHSCYCHSCNNGIRVNDDIFRNESFFFGGGIFVLKSEGTKLWHHYVFNPPISLMPILGATSIEKNPKISASGRNFLDPLPPFLKKGLMMKTSVFHT